jgi:hypothetical protein
MPVRKLANRYDRRWHRNQADYVDGASPADEGRSSRSCARPARARRLLNDQRIACAFAAACDQPLTGDRCGGSTSLLARQLPAPSPPLFGPEIIGSVVFGVLVASLRLLRRQLADQLRPFTFDNREHLRYPPAGMSHLWPRATGPSPSAVYAAPRPRPQSQR